MNLLIRGALLLAAGAAGWALARRASHKPEEDPHVVYLDDEDAVIDAPQQAADPEPVPARVIACHRSMDPFSLTGGSVVTFGLEDGTELTFRITGEGGLYLKTGDTGMLTWSGNTLILFEKDNGDVFGGMFYAPAVEESTHE